MKRKKVLKSLADLSPEVVEPEPARPVQRNPEPGPADAKEQRENQLHIRASECSDFAGYPHWGLND